MNQTGWFCFQLTCSHTHSFIHSFTSSEFYSLSLRLSSSLSTSIPHYKIKNSDSAPKRVCNVHSRVGRNLFLSFPYFDFIYIKNRANVHEENLVPMECILFHPRPVALSAIISTFFCLFTIPYYFNLLNWKIFLLQGREKCSCNLVRFCCGGGFVCFANVRFLSLFNSAALLIVSFSKKFKPLKRINRSWWIAFQCIFCVCNVIYFFQYRSKFEEIPKPERTNETTAKDRLIAENGPNIN